MNRKLIIEPFETNKPNKKLNMYFLASTDSEGKHYECLKILSVRNNEVCFS